MRKMFRAENFNVMASNMVSFQRSLPDMRHPDCQDINYPKRLPKASIIIIFHNEVWSTLMRTIWSIINRTPKELLEEIILVDDLSTRANLRHELVDYLDPLPVNIKVMRMRMRQGVVRARVQAADAAVVRWMHILEFSTNEFILSVFRQGNVLVFLDSHVECTDGWLEPLLSRIASDRSVVAVPHIDSISAKTMAYRRTNLKIFGFDWDMLYFE